MGCFKIMICDWLMPVYKYKLYGLKFLSILSNFAKLVLLRPYVLVVSVLTVLYIYCNWHSTPAFYLCLRRFCSNYVFDGVRLPPRVLRASGPLTVQLKGIPLMVKRRSRSSPPAAKRPPVLLPGTPGPFEEDKVRTGLQATYPGASPVSTGKLITLKRQLLSIPDMITRNMAQQGSSSLLSGTSLADQPEQSQDLTQEGPSNEGNIQQLPLGDDVVQMPAGNARRPRERPDLEDVVT